MTLYTEVLVAEFVVGEAVGAELHDYCAWAVFLHDGVHDLDEEAVVGLVVDADAQGDVQGVVFSWALADGVAAAGSREEVIPVLMERHSHDPIRQEERLLHPIPMMHINIQIQHPRMEPQQLQYRQHNIIRIAEPTGLTLLRMVQPPTPINTHIGIARQQHMRRINRPPTRILTELIQAAEAWTVATLAHVELVFAFAICDDLFALFVFE